jgi:hypothetical protein
MSARLLSVVGLVLVVLGPLSQAVADPFSDVFHSIAQDAKRRNCWPEPFVGSDRASVRAPFVTQVANGWRRQNMLGEFHFEPGSGQLNEAGRLKVRWILLTGPQQHRLIYVHVAEKNEETAARMAAVQQLAVQITPNDVPPVMPTAIADDDSPADRADAIGRKFQATTPSPRLSSPSAGGSGGGGGDAGGKQ